jgi:hypothetical protein
MRSVSENVGFSTDSLPVQHRNGSRNAPQGASAAGSRNFTEGIFMERIDRFYKVITGQLALSALPIDLEESELMAVLNELECFDLHTFEKASSNVQRMRAHIRYLAALWPDANMLDLTNRIHALINNSRLEFSDIMTILRGERLSETAQLSDLRTVLVGGQLYNSQTKTNEVPVPTIQGIGRCLRDGMSLAETSRIMHVSVDSVRAVENLLGLRSAYLKKLEDRAVDAVRDAVSVRGFASANGITRARAESLLKTGRSVLVELGEVQQQPSTTEGE